MEAINKKMKIGKLYFALTNYNVKKLKAMPQTMVKVYRIYKNKNILYV